MNVGYREENSIFCYFHPKEVVIGVCPLCLNERLLILAAKQNHGHHLPSAREISHRRAFHGSNNVSSHHRRPSLNLPKIFSFGSFLNRHWKSGNSGDHFDDTSTSSQEDSFISIRFEGDGAASWDKGTVSKASLDLCNNNNSWINHSSIEESRQKGHEITKETLIVIEHAQPRAVLRWRKRIGHLFHLINWKRTNKGSVCHVGTKVEGVKVRKGWIRTLTRKGTKE